MCNQDEFFMEPKEVEKDIALEEVSTTAEIFKEVDKSQECKGELEVLPSMEDNHQHGTIIFHDFEDSFLHNKSAPDHSI